MCLSQSQSGENKIENRGAMCQPKSGEKDSTPQRVCVCVYLCLWPHSFAPTHNPSAHNWPRCTARDATLFPHPFFSSIRRQSPVHL